MLISQLSRNTGVPIHTIRYYEKFGLFKGKKNGSVKSNNYTWYDDEVQEKLELVQEAKMIGFTLGEIKKLIDVWHSKKLPKEKKKEAIVTKMVEIDEKIRQLKDVKKMLRDGLEDIEAGRC